MRSALLALSMISLFASAAALGSEFCSGFEKGYKTGYKKAANTSLEPLAPLCPLQPLKGFGDPRSDFEHGYTIGYEKGREEGTR